MSCTEKEDKTPKCVLPVGYCIPEERRVYYHVMNSHRSDIKRRKSKRKETESRPYGLNDERAEHYLCQFHIRLLQNWSLQDSQHRFHAVKAWLDHHQNAHFGYLNKVWGYRGSTSWVFGSHVEVLGEDTIILWYSYQLFSTERASREGFEHCYHAVTSVDMPTWQYARFATCVWMVRVGD